MQAVIPPEWSFKFMGSPAALDFMRGSPIIRRLEESGKLEFLPVPDNYSVTDRQGLSTMFTDIHLYRDILAPAEHLLVWQPDSIMCANAPTTVNDFLEYDYVGAPWGSNAEFGGNGGLSLRRVSKILDVLVTKTRSIGNGALEDLWLSTRLKEMPGAVNANGSISKTFSVETVWDDHPLGYHVGWLGAHHGQVSVWGLNVEHVLKSLEDLGCASSNRSYHELLSGNQDDPRHEARTRQATGHSMIRLRTSGEQIFITYQSFGNLPPGEEETKRVKG